MAKKQYVLGIEKAIRYFGNRKAMADQIGVSRAAISVWKRRGRVAHRNAKRIELETGGHVSRYELTDAFD